MSRHRSPTPSRRAPLRPDRGAHVAGRPGAPEAPTTVLDLAALVAADRPTHCGPAPRRRRADTTVRDARRSGFAAAGVATAALAVVAPSALSFPQQDVGPTLALSAESTRLAPTGAGVAPVVVTTSDADPATADLFKAGDRVRRDAEQARAAADEQARAAAAADEARAAQAAQAARAARVTNCGADSNYGGVADSVQKVGNALECVFPGRDIGGIGSRSGPSDHPSGYALDVMTRNGGAIADCVMEHADALGVTYAIWDQRINTGSGWRGMEDRGGDTANHRDHVHISFARGADPDVSALRSCSG